jgi:TolA-binding protein
MREKTILRFVHPVLAMAVAGLWLSLPFAALGQPLTPRPRLEEMDLPALQAQVERLVAAQKYEETLPYFEAIKNNLQYDKDNPAIKKILAKVNFFQARVLMELGRLPEAQAIFEKYLVTEPTGDDRLDVYLLLADTLSRQEKWADVVATIDRLRAEGLPIGDQRKLTINQMLGDAHIRLKNWPQAIDPLYDVFLRSKDELIRNAAAAMITMALVESNAMDRLVKFVPIVYKTEARYDVTLNSTLLDAVEKCRNERQWGQAILLCRLVYFKSELVEHLTKRIADVKANLDRLKEQGKTQQSRELMMDVSYMARMLPALEQQLVELNKAAEYDRDVWLLMGDTYRELKRYWEAIYLFRSVYDRYQVGPEAEGALYGAFVTAMSMGDSEEALRHGNDYLAKYPTGKNSEYILLTMAEGFATKGEWDKVLKVVESVKKGEPSKDSLAFILTLEGNARFYQEDFQKAFEAFDACVKLDPDSSYAQTARYWCALAKMFQEKFKEALALFEEYVKIYGENGEFYQDAQYRIATAYYGMDDIEKAEAKLKAFVKKYPEEELTPEALNMLWDILASNGKLNEALAVYKRCREVVVHYGQKQNQPPKMVFIDYAAIQSARVLELENRYPEIVQLMTEYLNTWGENGNFAEATYWLGTAKTKMNKLDEAYGHFLASVVRFGNNPKLDSVDMILRDLIQASSDPAHPAEFAKIREKLYSEMIKANARSDQKTLYLRLAVLFAETEQDVPRREILMRQIMREENLDSASALTLDVMASEALKKNDKAFADKVYRRFMKAYPDSDLAVGAYIWQINNLVSEGRLDEAKTMLVDVKARWGTSDAGGWARLRDADIARLEKRYDDAIEKYKEVLKVREWKGPFWPEALYGMGLCEMEKGRYAEANNLFERIYVAYEAYTQWTSKAYLKSSECLEKLEKKNLAITALQQMLKSQQFKGLPELERAKEQLQRLGGAPLP